MGYFTTKRAPGHARARLGALHVVGRDHDDLLVGELAGGDRVEQPADVEIGVGRLALVRAHRPLWLGDAVGRGEDVLLGVRREQGCGDT
jgi:hypothetical protein